MNLLQGRGVNAGLGLRAFLVVSLEKLANLMQLHEASLLVLVVSHLDQLLREALAVEALKGPTRLIMI